MREDRETETETKTETERKRKRERDRCTGCASTLQTPNCGRNALRFRATMAIMAEHVDKRNNVFDQKIPKPEPKKKKLRFRT